VAGITHLVATFIASMGVDCRRKYFDVFDDLVQKVEMVRI
jgi:hypothetical protein